MKFLCGSMNGKSAGRYMQLCLLSSVFSNFKGKPSPAAEPVVSPDPFCGETPQHPLESESADGFAATG